MWTAGNEKNHKKGGDYESVIVKMRNNKKMGD